MDYVLDIDQTVGLSELDTKTTTTITYPNPVKDILKIDFGTFKNTKKNISLSNSLGQILLFTDLKDTDQLDVSFLPGGIYFLSIENEKNRKVLKLIKE